MYVHFLLVKLYSLLNSNPQQQWVLKRLVRFDESQTQRERERDRESTILCVTHLICLVSSLACVCSDQRGYRRCTTEGPEDQCALVRHMEMHGVHRARSDGGSCMFVCVFVCLFLSSQLVHPPLPAPASPCQHRLSEGWYEEVLVYKGSGSTSLCIQCRHRSSRTRMG